MPEEFSLPGIDPAPAAPAAPADPAQGAEDNATQSASVDTGAQAPTDDAAPDPVEVERKREAKGVQKRINELTAERKAAEQRAERALALVEQLATRGLQQQPQEGRQDQRAQGDEPPPDKSKFTSWEEYNAAQARWVTRQELRAELAARDRTSAQQRQTWEAQQNEQRTAQALDALHGITGNQMADAATRFADYVDVIESCPVNIPPRLEVAMAQSGAAGDVAYYLAKNPRVIQQLANMPDMQIMHNVTKIATAMRGNAANVSNAPAPGRPAGNRGAAANDYPKDATPEQHIAWEKRQQRLRSKG